MICCDDADLTGVPDARNDAVSLVLAGNLRDDCGVSGR